MKILILTDKNIKDEHICCGFADKKSLFKPENNDVQ